MSEFSFNNNSESMSNAESENLKTKITFVVPLNSSSRYHFLCKECIENENCYKTPLIKFHGNSVLMTCQHKKRKHSDLDDEFNDYKTILNNMPLNKLNFIKEYFFVIDDYSDKMKCKEKYENKENSIMNHLSIIAKTLNVVKIFVEYALMHIKITLIWLILPLKIQQ